MASGRPSGTQGLGPGALLSCLGFPGWGGLHLIVPTRADPPGLAERLALCQGDTDDADPSGRALPAGRLLPALLRLHRDLQPLDPCRWPWPGAGRGVGPETGPEPWPETWGHRYLLVCRWGAAQPLRISAWRRRRGTPCWIRTCAPMELSAFRQRFLGVPGGAISRQGPRGEIRR